MPLYSGIQNNNKSIAGAGGFKFQPLRLHPSAPLCVCATSISAAIFCDTYPSTVTDDQQVEVFLASSSHEALRGQCIYKLLYVTLRSGFIAIFRIFGQYLMIATRYLPSLTEFPVRISIHTPCQMKPTLTYPCTQCALSIGKIDSAPHVPGTDIYKPLTA